MGIFYFRRVIINIITNRLIIRSFEFSDDLDLFEMCSDYNTCYYAGWKPHPNVGVSRNIIAAYMYEKDTFAICRRDTDEFIGTISLYNNSFREGNTRELGFCLNERFRGKGYMKEAVSHILFHAFLEMKVDLVSACHIPNNVESKYVLLNNGFKYEGCLRQYRKFFNGDIVDGIFYSITKNEFKERCI